MPSPFKGFVIQSWPRTAKLSDAFPGPLLVFTFTLSRRSKQRLYLLKRLRPTAPAPGRRARRRLPPLPQSPLRLSLTAQLPFRFRLPGYVGGGAEGCSGPLFGVRLLCSLAVGIVHVLSCVQWELRRTRVRTFAAFICIEADTEYVCGKCIYLRTCILLLK